jgi:NACHT domain/Sulfatase-modifying factor enzyme 1
MSQLPASWWPAIVGFLGGGAVGGWMSHLDPLWTAASAIGAGAVGFVAKVWAKLEPRAVDACAGWIEATSREVFSRYYRYYRQQTIYVHRGFNVKGLSAQGPHALDLEHVFVDLSLDPKTVGDASGNLLRVPDELSRGAHAVWEWLAAPALSSNHFVLLGAPGTGKSTLLQHIALTLAAPRRRSRKTAVPKKIPLLLFLRDVAQAINEATDEKPLTLADAVRVTLRKQEAETGPPAWFEKQLKKGRCLVMLDGLDEVSDLAVRRKVVAWVQKQIRAHGNNRFILTSRPYGYRDNPLEDVSVLEVRPFSSEQVERFVRNWYLANELKSQLRDDPGVRLEAKKGADDLLRRLAQAPTLAELAVNPLLLTLIAHVHRFRSSLPGRRVELYAEICMVFLGRKQQATGIELDLTPLQKQEVLQPLAYHMMNKGNAEASARDVTVEEAEGVIHDILSQVSTAYSVADFLKMIENSSGLLIERENGIYSFSHLTFQEYLAGAHIQKEKLEAALLTHVLESWWHETIRLYAALGDATGIIEECLKQAHNSLAVLALALDCHEEALKKDPTVSAAVEKLLEDGIESSDPELRRRAAETLLHRRLRNLRRESDSLYVDTSLITHAEYQLFLDEKEARGEYYQPDHWSTDQFPAGHGQQPVVGVRANDAIAFCEWLTERQRDGWHFRLPRPTESLTTDKRPETAGYWTKSEDGLLDFVGPGHGTVQFHLEGIEKQCSEDSTFAHALTRWSEVSGAYNLAFDLDHTLDHALNHALAFDHALNRALALALDRTLNLAFDRSLAFEIALDLDRDFNRTRAFDRTRNLALGRSHDFDFSLALAHVKQLEDVLKTSEQWPLLSQIALHCAFVATWIIVQLINPDKKNDSSFQQLQSDLRRYARLRLLNAWFSLRDGAGARRWSLRSLLKRQAATNESVWQDAIVDAYVSLALLEERITGPQPAFEGIRIVREKDKDETTVRS